LLHGASQEGGRRAGTENVPYIVALGEASRLARERLPVAAAHLQGLRDRFHELLRHDIPGLILNGPETERLPNTLNVSFLGRDGREILAAMPEVAASTGSACHSGGAEPSPVLAAMGVPRDAGAGAVRFSLGRQTTQRDIERLLALLRAVAPPAA